MPSIIFLNDISIMRECNIYERKKIYEQHETHDKLILLMLNEYLRTAADPADILSRDMFAYWARALARCAAFASTADMLLKLAAALAKHKNNNYD